MNPIRISLLLLLSLVIARLHSLETNNPLLMTLMLVVALGVFSLSMISKIRLLLALSPVDRFQQLGLRLKQTILIALGQKRLLGGKKERISGIMHALIFWGFCLLLIRSLTLYGEAFVKGFQLPLLGEENIPGYLYLLLKDIMEGTVLLMVIYALFRRLVLKPKRLHNTGEAYLILGLIGLLMISDLLYDAGRYILITLHQNPFDLHYFQHPRLGSEFFWTPIAVLVAGLFNEAGAETSRLIMVYAFWTHIAAQLLFLNLLPHGKHFHVITALPNVFFKSLEHPHEKTRPLDLEDENAWEEESLGLNHIHQLNWKQGLDLYTCTECGRCKEVCPAYTTDKPLNLQDFNAGLKTELFTNQVNLIKKAGLSKTISQASTLQEIDAIKTRLIGLNSKKKLVGDVIKEDTLWSCTTCRACEEVCPVTIEHVPRILAMRQGQVLMQERYPKELNSAFRGLERNGNPWGIGYDKRIDWTEGLDVKLMADDDKVDYLLWVGCSGSFDDRSKRVSVSLVKILQKAGVSFAILGNEEKCTGDFARNVGNEMLYQMMAEENIEILNRYRVKKIITACPHCLNTLKHDYPLMGGHYEVVHHSEFIEQLIKAGNITVTGELESRLTYHDPCYLGRYNEIYGQPRRILHSVSKYGLIEPERYAQESFCCGAGGGRMWMEETSGKRINLERAKEFVDCRATDVATACPFCLTMLEDGMKELDRDEDIDIRDIAELVAQQMDKKQKTCD